MSQGAQVHSIAVLSQLRAALLKFGDEAAAAMTEMNRAAARTLDWVADDQAKHCKAQVRRGQDQVAAARTALARCQSSKVFGQTPSCREEQVALAAAERRLVESQEMVRTVQRWRTIVEHAIGEYQGRVRPLSTKLERDIPRAAAALARMGESLDGYLRVTSRPAQAVFDPSTGSPDDAAVERDKDKTRFDKTVERNTEESEANSPNARDAI